MPKTVPYSLFAADGGRKYLTPEERATFIKACERADDLEVRTFGLMLAHSGCRISEALNLTSDRIDLNDGTVVFESLKKRARGIYRAVPVPPEFMDSLNMVHDLRTLKKKKASFRLWPWGRTTGWECIIKLMAAAGIQGPQATPKGLRHAFGIRAIARGIQLNVLQKWLGHSDMKTTAIYAAVQGPEERKIAERMWTDD